MTGNRPSGEPSSEATETLLSHLIELRDRILRMFLAVLVVFLVLFPFANKIYTFLATPLMVHLPEGTSMIAIEVAAPFLIPFKLVLLLAVVIAIPYILYQLWAFVAPGLYLHEKKLAMPLVVSSTALFYLGMAFAYFVVFPLIFAFFTATAPEGVAVMTDISRYLDFVIMLFIAFGIAFEMPIATILLVSMGATTPDKLAAKRPYVIVGTFVVGMILTPPDIISQTLLALPMWILFEIGLLLSRIMERRKKAAGAAEGPGDDDPDGAGGAKPRKPGGSPPGGPDRGAPGASGAKPVAETPLPAAAAAGATVGSGEAPATTVSDKDSGEAVPAAEPPDSGQPAGPETPPPAVAEDAFWPLSEQEMDAELDRIEKEERATRERKTSETAPPPAEEPGDRP